MSATSKVWQKTYTFTLTAGQKLPVNAQAITLSCLFLSGDDVEVSFDDGERTPLIQGITVELPEYDPFNKVTFINNSAATRTVQVVISQGRIKDSRLNLTGSVEIKAGDSVGSPPIVTTTSGAAQVLAASSTSVNERTFRNLSKTDNVWIGDSNVGNDAAPRGHMLAPNEPYVLSSGGEVYFRRGAATNVSVSILEVS